MIFRFLISQSAWDVFKTSPSDLHWQAHLKNLSETYQKRRFLCDIFKTSEIHLKKTSFLWHLSDISNTSQKRRFLCYLFKVSQTYLRKDAYSVTSLIRLKNISGKYFWLFKNILQKWFHADKIDVGPLKTLKKWNVVFWEQCIVINQSVISISGLTFACCLSQ